MAAKKDLNSYKEVKLDKGGAKALYDGWNAGMTKTKKSAGTGKKKGK